MNNAKENIRNIERRIWSSHKRPMNSGIELPLLVWKYISLCPESFIIPQGSEMDDLLRQYDVSFNELNRCFRDLEKANPNFHKSFSGFFKFIEHHHHELELKKWMDVLKEMDYTETVDIKNVIREVFRKALDYFIKRNSHYEFTDTIEISRLMARLAYTNIESNEGNITWIPFVRTGEMAIAAYEESNHNAVVHAQAETEITFSIAIFNCIIHDVPTENFRMNWELKESPLRDYNTFLSFIPMFGRNENEQLEVLLDEAERKASRTVLLTTQGILFKQNLAKHRKLMVYEKLLSAIIFLPDNLLPYSRIRLVLLVFDRKQKPDNVIFVNAENLFQGSKRSDKLSEETIINLVNTIQQRTEVPGFSKLVNMDEIKANLFNLSVNRYIQQPKSEVLSITLEEAQKQAEELQQKLIEVSRELTDKISQFKKLVNK